MTSFHFEHPETPGLVSVVIPTRNGERYIGAALESIAQQTCERWEVIVVEDGSRDATEGIVADFAARFPRRRVHYQRNETSKGAAAARGLAFSKAAGEFIALLDCDDRWLPNHLAACLAALEEDGVDVAYSAAAMCEDGTDHMIGFWGPTRDEMADFPQSLLGRSYVTPSATVVRRTVIADVGAWNPTCRYCEDAEFFLRAAELGKRFRCVGGVHCLYRKCHEGATTQKLAATIEEYAEVSSWFKAMPGTRSKQSDRLVAKSFALAAQMHMQRDPQCDSSARKQRAAPLLYRAWRQRPSRVRYLISSLCHAVRHGWSADGRPTPRRLAPTAAAPLTPAVPAHAEAAAA